MSGDALQTGQISSPPVSSPPAHTVFHLSAASVSSSLILSLSAWIPNTNQSIPVNTLIDSGSTHCFLDSNFIASNSITTTLLVNPIQLHLFDGSSSSEIVSSTALSCTFPDGSVQSIEFFVTKLDTSVSAVLGYSWLTRTNPCIDWASSQLSFTAPIVPESPDPPMSSPPELPESKLAPPKELITPQEPSTPCYPLSPASCGVSTPISSRYFSRSFFAHFLNLLTITLIHFSCVSLVIIVFYLVFVLSFCYSVHKSYEFL